jgi:hypothetical protein
MCILLCSKTPAAFLSLEFAAQTPQSASTMDDCALMVNILPKMGKIVKGSLPFFFFVSLAR